MAALLIWRSSLQGIQLAGPVRLLQADYTNHETTLANAVARIALNAIADRLPQWMASKPSGQLIFGRQHQPRRRARSLQGRDG